MSQIIDSIKEEVSTAVQAEIDSKVLDRLKSALQSANDKKQSLEGDIADLEAEIAAREPQPVAEPTGQAEGDVPVHQG